MSAAVSSLEEQKQTILDLMPIPGSWSDRDYLWLTDHTRRLVELTDGQIEVLPTPTDLHQGVLQYMFLKFHAFITPMGGKVHFAPIRMRIRPGKFREPDLLLVKSAKETRRHNRYWIGADLTLEVVSEEKPERGLVDKRHDYAEGNVPEYWIVNPQTETITVLRLENAVYVEHGVFQRGQQATSVILPGLAVNVADVFDVDSPPNDPVGD
jgi:Uma2 family endonuclease